LLGITTILFLLFVIAEIIGGIAGIEFSYEYIYKRTNIYNYIYFILYYYIIANSLSLLGDAGAMSIDVATYGCNFYAEYCKYINKNELNFSSQMFIKVYIPAISVTSLLGVTAYVTVDAVRRLLGHKEVEVNVSFLFIYSILNMTVDVICGILFFLRRNDIFHEVKPIETGEDTIYMLNDNSTDSMDTSVTPLSKNNNPNNNTTIASTSTNSTQKNTSENNLVNRNDQHGDMEVELDEISTETSNLNMMSAFTHLGGDTLRTLSVLLAAVISTVFPSIEGSKTDAWAAIVVSATIVVTVSPLIFSIHNTAQRLITENKNNKSSKVETAETEMIAL
jgi:Co/Zn/Cd efflux system component